MKKEILGALNSFTNVKQMILHLPSHIWDLFLPDNLRDLALLETNLIVLKKREKARNKVIAIQKACGFPFRPNASLRETRIKARIEDLKRDKDYSDRYDDSFDED